MKSFSLLRNKKAFPEKRSSKKIKRLKINNIMEFCDNQFNELREIEDIMKYRIVRKIP